MTNGVCKMMFALAKDNTNYRVRKRQFLRCEPKGWVSPDGGYLIYKWSERQREEEGDHLRFLPFSSSLLSGRELAFSRTVSIFFFSNPSACLQGNDRVFFFLCKAGSRQKKRWKALQCRVSLSIPLRLDHETSRQIKHIIKESKEKESSLQPQWALSA